MSLTGTDLLMNVMEDFSKNGESTGLVVIFKNENNQAIVKSNCCLTDAMGLIRWADAQLDEKARRTHRDRHE